MPTELETVQGDIKNLQQQLSQLPTRLVTAETWLQKHERLIIVTLVLFAALFLGSKFLDKSAADADSKAAATQQTLIASQALVAQQAKLLESEAATVQQQQLALAQISNQLAQIQASTSAALAKSVDKVKSATTDTEIVNNIASAYPELNFNPTPEVGDRLAFTQDQVKAFTITRLNYDSLQTVDAAKDKVLDSQKKTIDDQSTLILDQSKHIDTLNVEIKDADAASKAKLDAATKNARKSKRNWFLRGLAVGGAIVTAIVLHY